ncbi:MAG: transcription factor S [Candidatus Woesearchaeota archaeon]
MMKFCPKCGGILFPKNTKEGMILYCKKCGYEEKAKAESVKIKEKINEKTDIKIFTSESENMNVFPIADVECPKCGHRQAYYTMEQTRSSDEPPTRFFKCVKCGYVWREYS